MLKLGRPGAMQKSGGGNLPDSCLKIGKKRQQGKEESRRIGDTLGLRTVQSKDERNNREENPVTY